MTRSRGFTLLEVLVAIAVFAITAAIAWGALSRVLADRDRLLSERAFWRALSINLLRIEDDLRESRPRTVRGRIGEPLPAFVGRPVDTRALAPPAIELTRGGAIVLPTDTRSDLSRVAWRLNEKGELLRLVWPVLDQGPETQPLEAVVLTGVREMRLRFYSPARGWVDHWPVEGLAETLPRAVELHIVLPERGEFMRLVTLRG